MSSLSDCQSQLGVCVCVCVCVREREREGERERRREEERECVFVCGGYFCKLIRLFKVKII